MAEKSKSIILVRCDTLRSEIGVRGALKQRGFSLPHALLLDGIITHSTALQGTSIRSTRACQMVAYPASGQTFVKGHDFVSSYADPGGLHRVLPAQYLAQHPELFDMRDLAVWFTPSLLEIKGNAVVTHLDGPLTITPFISNGYGQCALSPNGDFLIDKVLREEELPKKRVDYMKKGVRVFERSLAPTIATVQRDLFSGKLDVVSLDQANAPAQMGTVLIVLHNDAGAEVKGVEVIVVPLASILENGTGACIGDFKIKSAVFNRLRKLGNELSIL